MKYSLKIDYMSDDKGNGTMVIQSEADNNEVFENTINNIINNFTKGIPYTEIAFTVDIKKEEHDEL